MHADGTPFIMVGDTPWALPWRSTYEHPLIYAQNRKQKGFNTALLMSLQPDRGATGPDARDTEQGFAVAFADLPEGHINQINTEYYQYLDSLMAILVAHEIVPVYQPVFHGFGSRPWIWRAADTSDFWPVLWKGCLLQIWRSDLTCQEESLVWPRLDCFMSAILAKEERSP